MKILAAIPLVLVSLQSWSLQVAGDLPTISYPAVRRSSRHLMLSRRQQPQNLPQPHRPSSRPLGPPLPKAHHLVPSQPKLPLVQGTPQARTPQLQEQPLGKNPSQPQVKQGPLVVDTKRDTECKNCPYGGCLNAGIIWTGQPTKLSCWTQGEEVNRDRTWLRHQFGAKPEDFCYVSPFDLQESVPNYRTNLTYCGAKSELNFYLPSATVKTDLYTECSLCPYRDCEGVEFFQSGVQLEINCVVLDGWLQITPNYENGTRIYFRTSDHCYVSESTVRETVNNMTISTGNGAAPNLLLTDRLPQCGPIPHMRLTDRPLPPVPGASQRSNTTIYIPVPVPTPKHKGSPVAPSYSRITNVPTRGVQALSPSPALSGSPRPKSPVSLDPSRPYPSPTYSKQPGFAYPHDQTPDDTLDSWCPGWRSCPGSDINQDDNTESDDKTIKRL